MLARQLIKGSPLRGAPAARRVRGGYFSGRPTKQMQLLYARATPQAASRPPLTRPGPSVAARHLPALRGVTPQGEPLQVAAFSAVTIYLSLYLIPRPCATVFERKRLLFVVFWVAWRWKAGSTFAVTRYYPIPCNCKSAFRPAHFLIDNLNSRIVKYSEIMKF